MVHDSAKPRQQLQAIVSGRVQRVGFRAFVRESIRRESLPLDGWVRNQPDHSVLVMAWGSPEALERLLLILHKGPFFSRVDKVDSTLCPAPEDAPPPGSGFSII